MIKLSEYIGKGVVTLSEATVLGHVTDVLYDKRLKRVRFLEVGGENEYEGCRRFLPLKKIRSVNDYISVMNLNGVLFEDEADLSRAEPIWSAEIVTTEGVAQGRLCEIEIADLSGVILRFMTESGELPRDSVANIGKKLFIVYEDGIRFTVRAASPSKIRMPKEDYPVEMFSSTSPTEENPCLRPKRKPTKKSTGRTYAVPNKNISASNEDSAGVLPTSVIFSRKNISVLTADPPSVLPTSTIFPRKNISVLEEDPASGLPDLTVFSRKDISVLDEDPSYDVDLNAVSKFKTLPDESPNIFEAISFDTIYDTKGKAEPSAELLNSVSSAPVVSSVPTVSSTPVVSSAPAASSVPANTITSTEPPYTTDVSATTTDSDPTIKDSSKIGAYVMSITDEKPDLPPLYTPEILRAVNEAINRSTTANGAHAVNENVTRLALANTTRAVNRTELPEVIRATPLSPYEHSGKHVSNLPYVPNTESVSSASNIANVSNALTTTNAPITTNTSTEIGKTNFKNLSLKSMRGDDAQKLNAPVTDNGQEKINAAPSYGQATVTAEPISASKPDGVSVFSAVTYASDRPVTISTAGITLDEAFRGSDSITGAADAGVPAKIISDYNFLLGRRILTNIRTREGEILLFKDTVITFALIDKARKSGKLLELILNSK
ncbi:MAG: PRC-barrel domain-containing protein [Clostridiaceae bacterium]|jgi:sporulation protein YlmC with PRC-barrel domain|nr:PRC-barrel domain-containing protein [Clostridiaceae bacterium]